MVFSLSFFRTCVCLFLVRFPLLQAWAPLLSFFFSFLFSIGIDLFLSCCFVVIRWHFSLSSLLLTNPFFLLVRAGSLFSLLRFFFFSWPRKQKDPSLPFAIVQKIFLPAIDPPPVPPTVLQVTAPPPLTDGAPPFFLNLFHEKARLTIPDTVEFFSTSTIRTLFFRSVIRRAADTYLPPEVLLTGEVFLTHTFRSIPPQYRNS